MVSLVAQDREVLGSNHGLLYWGNNFALAGGNIRPKLEYHGYNETKIISRKLILTILRFNP